jgi:Cu/Ag efflux protein CusF
MSEAFRRSTACVAAALALAFAAACGPSKGEVAQPEQAESTEITPVKDVSPAHLFRGSVQAVDTSARTVTVLNDNVEGWMTPMTMTYHVSNEAVLDTLKIGDEIAARVYDGDFKTLYDVEVMPAGGEAAPQAAK